MSVTETGGSRASQADIETILAEQSGVEPDLLAANGDTPLSELGVDSLALLELEAVVLDRYGVEIPPAEESVQLSTRQIVEIINQPAPR